MPTMVREDDEDDDNDNGYSIFIFRKMMVNTRRSRHSRPCKGTDFSHAIRSLNGEITVMADVCAIHLLYFNCVLVYFECEKAIE